MAYGGHLKTHQLIATPLFPKLQCIICSYQINYGYLLCIAGVEANTVCCDVEFANDASVLLGFMCTLKTQ